MQRFFRIRYLLVLIIALILATGMLGFAAANTMPTSTNAGDGAVAISGYTISNVTYTLNAADPSKIDAVNFDVAGANKPGNVKSRLVTSGAWYTCATATTGTGPWAFTCGTTSPVVTVLAADNLQVVAAQ